MLFSGRVLPFDTAAARVWGRLSAELGHPGADLMIAATALARGATVVTGKVADYERTDVTLQNPF
ncbi:MAG: PIN domain-containing protein [Pseudomonadota bacterium]